MLMRFVDCLCVFSVVAVGTFGGVGAAQSVKADADVQVGKRGEELAHYIRRAGALGFSGSVLAARDGEVVVAAAAGWADVKRKQPLDSTALFEIASASKPMTALAVVMLARDGRLGLDDPISKHLPDVPKDCSAITVRHLIQHTSGIPGSNSEGAGEQLGPVLKSFLRGGPQHPPGTHWEYWNQGYALLSEVIARAAGRSYVEQLRTAIFEPCGMRTTRFTGDKSESGEIVAVGSTGVDAPRSALEHPYGAYDFRYRGMGGVVTNVWDLWRWDRALHDSKLLDESWTKQLFTPGLGDYALGWYARTDERGRTVQSHSGGVRGFVCDVRRYPAENACVFVLCNRDLVRPHDVADAIEALLLDDQPRPPLPPAPLDKNARERLEGEYETKQGRRAIVEARGDSTSIRIEWSGPGGPVTHAVLGQDANGAIVLFEWSAATVMEVEGKGRAKGFQLGADQYVRKR